MRATPGARSWTRRRFLTTSGSVLGGLVAGAAYTRYVEPEWLAVREINVPLSRRVPRGRPLRILHLSDFHASEDVRLEFIEVAVRKAIALRPDLICVTGDFITGVHDDFPRYREALKPLADAAPTFAVLGNHDGGRWVGSAGYRHTDHVRALLSGARIELLHNRSVEIQAAGHAVQLTGVGDLWAGELDANTAFNGAPAATPDATRLLLAHNPDSKELVHGQPWDLMLSGHTHGGQCDLVFFGTPFAPVADQRYVRGLGRWKERWIHVTAGIGNLHGLRLNCRPEVSVLNIA